MPPVDLDRLDLNLLRVFEALWAERHVTRAAARLGLTQSAASNALGRLRAAFKDDLFQRTPTGMEPTALARELAGPVGAALDAVRAAVALNRPFDPAHAEESFTLGMSDYAEFVLAPPLIAALRARAPGVSVVVRHVDREVVTALLDEDRAHLAIGQLPEPPTRMTRIMLLRDELVVLMRPDHPAAKEGLDLDAFLAWPHLLVSAVASREGAVDRALGGRLRSIVGIGSSSAALMRQPAGPVSPRSGRRSRALAATSIRSCLQDPASVAALPCPDRLAAFRGGTTCPHRNPRAAHVGSLRRTGCANGIYQFSA
jgi:DNA-binding transcriptional LysR family regulator